MRNPAAGVKTRQRSYRPVGDGAILCLLPAVDCCVLSLNETRESLRQWALAHQLSWIEDESNQDDTYDRNFLRLRVIPVLRERWPHFSEGRRPQRQPVRRAGTTAGRDVGGGAGVAGGRRWLAGYRAAGDDESAAPSGAAASLARRAAGADARPRGA